MPASLQARVEASQRRDKALKLRLAGATLDMIVQEGVYANKGTASREIRKALEAISGDTAREVLQMELGRLDILQMGLWGAARSGDVFAVDRILKIMEQRAKYLNLYNMPEADNTDEVKAALSDFLKDVRVQADRLDAAEAAAGELVAGEVVEG